MSALRIHGLCGLVLALFACGLVAQAPPSSSTPAEQAKGAARVDRYGDPLPAGAIARLGTTRRRLFGKRIILGFATDGKTLLTQTRDGVLQMLDPTTTRPFRHYFLASPDQEARGFELAADWKGHISGDGRIVVAFATYGNTILFDCATGKRRSTIPQEELFPRVKGGVSIVNARVQLSHDGRLLAVSGQQLGNKTQVALLDTTTGKAIHRFSTNENAAVDALAFTPDGRLVAFAEVAGEGKCRLRSWDTTSGKEVRSVKLPRMPVHKIGFLPDGKTFLVLTGFDWTLRLLDALSGKEIRTFSGKDTSDSGFTLSADGKAVAVASRGKARVWDVATGAVLRAFQHPALDNEAPRVFLSSDGKTLVAAAKYGLVQWDVTTGKQRYATGGHIAPIQAVAFSPDSRRLVSAGLDNSLRVWELPSSKEDRRFRLFARVADEEAYSGELGGACAHFTSDGQMVVAAWLGQPAQMWDASTARPVRQFGAGKGAYPCALSPDGKLLAAGTVDKRVQVWAAGTGKEFRGFVWNRPDGKVHPGLPCPVFSVAFSPDGRTLAAVGMVPVKNGALPQMRLWEVSTGRERLRTTLRLSNAESASLETRYVSPLQDPAGNISLITFSADGKVLAVGKGNVIYTWDVATGKEVRQFAGFDVVAAAMALSPDGKVVAAGRADGGIRLWRTDTGAVLGDVPGHEHAVLALAFSPDGKKLASGSDDSTTLLWDVAQLLQNCRQAVGTLSAAARGVLWAELGNSDATKAYRAVATLSADPQHAVALLKSRLRPIAPTDPKRLTRLLAELDSKRYAVRNRAMHDLAALGELARPALEQLLARKPALEMRRRVETLLGQLSGPVTAPAELRALRGIEVLERIGSPEARAVLQTLAGGAGGHRLTEEARASLVRLRRMEHAGQ